MMGLTLKAQASRNINTSSVTGASGMDLFPVNTGTG